MTQVEPYSRRTRRPDADQRDHRSSDQRRNEPPQGRPGRSSRRQPPPPPTPDEGGRRGSHATTYGQGFSWVVAWTIVGALIPGVGLIAAGRRRLGAAVLALLALGGVGLGIFAMRGNLLERGVEFAVNPKKLLMLAIGAAVVGVLWALVILLTNSQLRRYASLDGGQKVFSWVVVTALVVGVGVPAYSVGNNALIQRDLVNSVFAGDADDSGDSADSGPDTKAADPWAGTERINVLLIGSDAGATRVGIRPDTMIVASIQPSTGNTVLFSLPRNLERAPFPEGTGGNQAWPNGFYCPEQGLGHDCLLNAVWRWAEDGGKQYYSKYKNPGLRATEDAIQGVTGLKIDTYAMLNLKGFAQFINAIGGVRVNVRERLPIGGNSEHPVATGGYIEVGENQKLDGAEALWFARSRWSTNDYDRMRRQRCVIAAVVDQADPVTLATKFPKIAKALKDNMATGIPQSELQAWVELATRVQGATLTSLPFTDEVVSDRSNPDYDMIHSQVKKAIKRSEALGDKDTATATASASPSPSPSASAGTGTTKKKKKIDPTTAQDVSAVC